MNMKLVITGQYHILSIFNQIFEKLVYHRLNVFIYSNNILFKSQYAFQKKHSTQHAILDIQVVNAIQSNTNQTLFTGGIFKYLKEAFDTVDHAILLQKVNHYSIRGTVLYMTGFHLYLLGCSQVTELDSNLSSCVLGPLLFLIYINEIFNTSSKLVFFLFPDDTT